ncbi:MAG TPA: 1,4-alpha-glucan branching protein domain-containing protein [Capillimicrobium sp.]|nr:1,4-alpha-glucan branching protein domain-containing protein [Capillimicrobium sp.]
MTSRGARGELAIVLHSHMPYVEGFGTWPFGEEWLWEAMATSYLPLLDVLDAGAPVTLSLTPVLCDQLAAPGIGDRFLAFCRELRAESHERDARSADDPAVAAELRRAAGDYARAADAFEARGGDLLAALAPHAAWTSSATHAVLPLLATRAGVRLQLQTGIDAHRARFGDGWRGGFWLPECAHEPWLDPLLEEAGVHATCVDLTDVLSPEAHLTPLRSAAGPLLVPIDRATIELVWSPGGYPARAAYRDSHRRTACHHKPWANDAAIYDPERAAEQARADAADFVARARERVRDGGLCVCALDTELLGHWWHEGVTWLAAVVDEADRQGLPLAALDDALERHEPVAAPQLPTTSWGTPRDLWTWSGPQVAELAFAARRAELDVVAARERAGDRALRELLALQSSDWAFMVSRDVAAPYARERAEGHRAALAEALAAGPAAPAPLRSLAPNLARGALRQP